MQLNIKIILSARTYYFIVFKLYIIKHIANIMKVKRITRESVFFNLNKKYTIYNIMGT